MEQEHYQLQQISNTACNCSRRKRILDLPRYTKMVETPYINANETHKMEKSTRSNTNETYRLERTSVVKAPSGSDIPTIFVITPTHARTTQKVDMTTLCQTLMHVPKLVWIVIEDSYEKTQIVTDLLGRCKIQSVHLNVQTPAKYQGNNKPRGVAQRNAALDWLRSHYTLSNCSGVVYFADDDNKYDLRLFDRVRFPLSSYYSDHLYM